MSRIGSPMPALPELLLEAPISLGLVMDAADEIPSADLASIAAAASAAGARAAVATLQSEAGSLLDGAGYVPATLDINITAHRMCAGHRDMSRPHEHVRILGARDSAGHRRPARADAVRAAAPLVQLAHTDAIEGVLLDSGLSILPDPMSPWGWTIEAVAAHARYCLRAPCPPDGLPVALQLRPMDARDTAERGIA